MDSAAPPKFRYCVSRAQGGIPFMVYGTSLQFLGLHSLKNINNGRPLILSNPDLCYASSVNWSSIVTSGNVASVKGNKNETICGQFCKIFNMETLFLCLSCLGLLCFGMKSSP